MKKYNTEFVNLKNCKNANAEEKKKILRCKNSMKYLDLVELIKEKPAYTKNGVKVGNFGAIMSEKPINGKWQVVFSEFYTGKDIADIMVAEEDLKVHESVPKDRYPKK